LANSVVCDPEVFLGVSKEVFIDSTVTRVHQHTAGAPRKN